MVKICQKCKKFVPLSSTVCPMCGNINFLIENQPTTQQIPLEIKNETVAKKKHSKFLIVFFAIAIVMSVCAYMIFNNVLWGKDRIVYDLVSQHAYTFKNHSSVRVVSGCAGISDNKSYNGTYAFLRLSATNGFGATVTGYYFLDEKRIEDLEEENKLLEILGIDFDNSYMISLCDNKKQLNIEKINCALNRKFK